MKTNKVYYHLIENGKFRTWYQTLQNGNFKYGLDKKVKVLGISFWTTIMSFKSRKEPKLPVGCIPHKFRKLSEILNNIQCYN